MLLSFDVLLSTIIHIHSPVDALQAERRNNLRGYFETLIDLGFLLVCPLAQHEIDLCATSELIPYAETYTRVRVRS